MVINLNGVYGGRGATPVRASTVLRRQAQGAIQAQHPGVIKRIERVLRWMHRGYVQANAGDLASAVAYSALIALIPTLLLTLSVAGLFFRIDTHLQGDDLHELLGAAEQRGRRCDSDRADGTSHEQLARRVSAWHGSPGPVPALSAVFRGA